MILEIEKIQDCSHYRMYLHVPHDKQIPESSLIIVTELLHILVNTVRHG